MLVLLPVLAGVALAHIDCELGWSYYKNHCYKHILDWNNRVIPEKAQEQCVRRGGWVSGLEDEAEMKFLVDISVRTGDWSKKMDAIESTPIAESLRTGALTGSQKYNDFLLLGATRIGPKRYRWYSSNSTYFPWCRQWGLNEPTDVPFENQITMQLHTPCLYDVYGTGIMNGIGDKGFLHYVCKKPLPCKSDKRPDADGTCVCKDQYYDVTELKLATFGKAKKNEQCVEKLPCDFVTTQDEKLSIIFIMDSSESISDRDWDSMVGMLRTGSIILTNKTSIGFVQFSTKINKQGWLKERWTKKDFTNGVPEKQVKGYTNTPAALEEAYQMFARDRSARKIAILITDGMPKVNEESEKEDDIKATIDAAQKLSDAGVRLITFGFGEVMKQKETIELLRTIVDRPTQDFFVDVRPACQLDRMQLFYILHTVCKAYNDDEDYDNIEI